MNLSLSPRPAIAPRFSSQTPTQAATYWDSKLTWVTRNLDTVDFTQVTRPRLETLKTHLEALNRSYIKITEALKTVAS